MHTSVGACLTASACGGVPVLCRQQFFIANAGLFQQLAGDAAVGAGSRGKEIEAVGQRLGALLRFLRLRRVLRKGPLMGQRGMAEVIYLAVLEFLRFSSFQFCTGR